VPIGKRDIRLVVFDLAGTTIDFGCNAPVAAFIEAFARHGIAITPAEARAPMGLNKKDHVRALLALPAVAESWRRRHGRDWDESDVDRVYQDFMPLQLQVVDRHCEVIPGLLDCLAALRRQEIRIATTTGYFPEAAQRVYRLMREQGFVPDVCMGAGDAPAGRPAPYMIFRIMEKLRIEAVSAVLKVGDTVHDIEEGLNAGVWSAGVIRTSSEVGCTEAELSALSDAEAQARLASARVKLQNAGAHAIVDSIADVPALIHRLNEQMQGRS